MKYLNVEIIPTLEKLVVARYGSKHPSFELDEKMFRNTYRQVWVWIMNDNGTLLLPMVSCLRKEHWANEIIEEYAMSNPSTMVYIIEFANESYGHIYDMKIKRLYALLKENSVSSYARNMKAELRISFRILQKIYCHTKPGQLDSRITSISKEMRKREKESNSSVR